MSKFLLPICVAILSFLPKVGMHTNSSPGQAVREAAIATTAVPWIANTGQWQPGIAFCAATFSGKVLVNQDQEIIYALPVDSTSGYVLKEKFVGLERLAQAEAVRGTQRVVAQFNYFLGSDSSAWRSRVPAYEGVQLGEIWAGIALALQAHNENVEKLFYVAPKADPTSIQVEIEGAETLAIAHDGRLMVSTPAGTLYYSAPVAYQWIAGKKRVVTVSYHLHQSYPNRYGFTVENYDPSYELVIDPLLASTFVGDGGNDWGQALAVDEAGHVFVTGYTWSDNFPTTPGSYNEPFNGVKDAYVAKFSNDLSTLLASTFIGGSSWENGLAITVDGTGEVLIAGATGSANFPIAGSAYDRTYNGGSNDVFVCRLANDLTSLITSTFIGGQEDDYGYGLTVDQAGHVFVTGRTESTNYPTQGAYDATFNGGFEDVFVTKLNSDLSALLASTYLGGHTDEGADAIVTDDAGNVFVTGFTYSDDFPTAGISYDSTHNGSGDIYVA
ncbi:MAG: hypothetical protein D6772_04745, partial [Bacteroidetes bacterium]